MRIRRYPEWVLELEKIYKPFLEGCHLMKNAPREAVEAFEKAKEYYKNN